MRTIQIDIEPIESDAVMRFRARVVGGKNQDYTAFGPNIERVLTALETYTPNFSASLTDKMLRIGKQPYTGKAELSDATAELLFHEIGEFQNAEQPPAPAPVSFVTSSTQQMRLDKIARLRKYFGEDRPQVFEWSPDEEGVDYKSMSDAELESTLGLSK